MRRAAAETDACRVRLILMPPRVELIRKKRHRLDKALRRLTQIRAINLTVCSIECYFLSVLRAIVEQLQPV